MRGKMKGKSIGLLFMLLFALFALIVLVPEGAMATDIDCPDGLGGFQTHYGNPSGSAGTFCVEAIKLADTSVPCGSSTCYRFQYEIRSQFSGQSLSQVALTIPAAQFCSISILSPTERSVKIREYEPSTNFSFVDTNTDVITWDALKLDPSNKENIDVYLTQTGFGPQVMELKTDTGQQYIAIDGPICCSSTQIPTAINYGARAFGWKNGPSLVFNFDSCTGEALTPGGNFQELEYGAFVCSGESGDRCKPWIIVKKLGPRSGATLIGQNVNDVTKYASFFGFGNKIYKSDINAPSLNNTPCTQEKDSGQNVVVYEQVTYDKLIRVDIDSCGEVFRAYKYNPATGLYDVLMTNNDGLLRLFIAPGKSNGQPDTSQLFEIMAGPSDGAIIYANPSYLCLLFGWGCVW